MAKSRRINETAHTYELVVPSGITPTEALEALAGNLPSWASERGIIRSLTTTSNRRADNELTLLITITE